MRKGLAARRPASAGPGEAGALSPAERLEVLAGAAPVLLFIASAAFQWEYANPPFYAFTGMPDAAAEGDGWRSALHPDERRGIEAAWRDALAEPGRFADCEARLRRADGIWRWHLIRVTARVGEAGDATRLVGSCTDIDDRRMAEAQQSVMLAELQHRVRNILAVVRSVLTRTLSTSRTLEHFADHMTGRIGALARVQSAAARTPDRLISLDELVHNELTSHGGRDEAQYAVSGPAILLPDKIASPIGLAIHELTTNSLKYGALAAKYGAVQVQWHVAAASAACPLGCLVLDWSESGVPVTDMRPKHSGFGRELIEQGLPYELGAVTELVFRAGGMRCRVELPPGSFRLADFPSGQGQ